LTSPPYVLTRSAAIRGAPAGGHVKKLLRHGGGGGGAAAAAPQTASGLEAALADLKFTQDQAFEKALKIVRADNVKYNLCFETILEQPGAVPERAQFNRT